MEPLYSNSADIGVWLQSTRAQNSVPGGKNMVIDLSIFYFLLFFRYPALYLLNKIYLHEVRVDTAPELCKNVIFFGKKYKRHFYLCYLIYAYFR